MTLNSLRFECDGFIVQTADRCFLSSGAPECITIMRPGYVVAWIEPRDDEDPDVHFVGTRPFHEDRDAFWEVTKLACEFAKLLKPAPK